MKKWLLLILLLASNAYADLKIGVVDVNQILQSSPLMISLNDNLTKKFKTRQDEINNASKALQDEMTQLDTNGMSLKPDERTQLQNKILGDKANVQILTASFERDLAIAKDEDFRTFMAKLSAVINKIAKDGTYDLIEQKTNMLFVNQRIDITAEVLKQLS